MKMSKASSDDIDMAIMLAGYLESIERGYMPDELTDGEECGEFIDTSDNEQYDRLIDGLQLLMRKGSIGRVVLGMAVVCNPNKKFIDPSAETIEGHPDLIRLERENKMLMDAMRMARFCLKFGDGKAAYEFLDEAIKPIIVD